MNYSTLMSFGKAVIQHRIPNVEQLNAVIALDSGKRNGLLKCLAGLVGEDVLVPLVKASIVHVKGHIRNGRPVKGYNRRMAEQTEQNRKAAIQKKIASIHIDFSKDNYLPRLNDETLKKLGKPDKPVLLKLDIIEKNRKEHSDLSDADYNYIIGKSLYDHDSVVPANKKKPAYFNFMCRIGENKHTVVLLEMSETKDSYEIVNLHFLKDRQRKQKEKRGEEIYGAGGQPTR